MSRLLFVTGTPADVRSGSGTYVGISVLRSALLAAGHAVDLIAPPRSSAGLLSRLVLNLRARAASRRERYDARVGFDLDGLFLPRSGGRRVAAIKGVIADELRFESGTIRARLRTAALLERANVRRADVVVATSRYAGRRLSEEYGVDASRIRIVPEPIDLARWAAALASVPKTARGDLTVLCVAHLYPRKRVANLVRAASLVETAARYRIVGVGPESRRLRRLVDELDLGGRVDFLGHVSFDRLVEEYRSADVFCLPSVQEGFGIVFLEAMAAGLPVVACRAASVPEIVEDGETGVLAPPDDVPALSRAIDGLLRDETRCRELGDRGRRRVARCDAPVVAGAFLEAVLRER